MVNNNNGQNNIMVNDNNDNKVILVMRYKLQAPSIFLHYTTFCNLIQMPAWVNIMGQHSSIGRDLVTYNYHFQSPTIYDYFGIELKKLSATTETAGRCKFHRPFPHDSEYGLALFVELKPNYFLIESEIHILSFVEDCGGDGRAKLDQRIHRLLVPVILKDNFYYICPGEENSLIYRVHHPTNIFFTSEGHDVLKSLIGKAFTPYHWCYAGEIKIVLPKQSKPVTNWDNKSNYDIGVCVPYPVVSTNTVPDSSWCSVQSVCLNDSQYIKDVVDNY